MDTRTERDSVGSLEVPSDAYYGIQSLRAAENFNITGLKMNPELICAFAMIKKAAALTNRDAGDLEPRIADAVITACDEIIQGGLRDSFIVDPVQGGAGTSANMNANEVIANRSLELMGYQKGDYAYVHPNDHINLSQSTNDVFPTAGKIAALRMLMNTTAELRRLQSALENKARDFQGIIKIGRTQLQDAVPISYGQVFHAYAGMIGRAIRRLVQAGKELEVINLGGTAIGTAVNAGSYYLRHITPTLSSVSGIPFRQADDLIDATQNTDCFVAVSGALKACAVGISKLCSDLRLLSSGPAAGLGEIRLPARQNGSSIMPGKVNPVIPEVVNQVAFAIIGNDQTITLAAESGQLELNAFEPVLLHRLFESIETLGRAAATLTDRCIAGIECNAGRCAELLKKSTGTSVALCPYIGYEKAAEIAKASLASGKAVDSIVLERHLLSPKDAAEILNPARLAFGTQQTEPCEKRRKR